MAGRTNFGNLTFMAPEPCIMIGTYDEQGNPDVMMAAWGCQSGRDEVKIHLSEHKTTDNLRLKKAFTVSFATESTVAESDYLGSVSAKEVPDKVAKAGFTVKHAPNVDAPVVEQYPLTLECTVVSLEDGVLVGKLVNTSADASILDKDSNIDMSLLKPVVFDGVGVCYRSLGSVVGKAWESGNKFK